VSEIEGRVTAKATVEPFSGESSHREKTETEEGAKGCFEVGEEGHP